MRNRLVIALAVTSACSASTAFAAPAGQNPFDSGAQAQSSAYGFPQEPVPGASTMPPSPAFSSLGTVPPPQRPDIPTSPTSAPNPPAPPRFQTKLRHPVPPPLPQKNGGQGRLPTYMPPAQAITPPPVLGETTVAPPHLTAKQAEVGTQRVLSQTIEVHPNQTYSVTLSGLAPNVVETPFANPRLITTQPDLIKSIPHGHAIVLAIAPETPVGAYITGANPNDPLIAFSFIPKKVAPRNYRLEIPGFVDNRAPEAPAGKSYQERIVAVMRDAVSDRVPDGWMQTRRKLPILSAPVPLDISPVQMWTGNRWRLVEYRLTNQTTSNISLVENDFYQKGILAVSFYPYRKILPNGQTNVFILENAPESKRGLGAVW
jgi:conjugal transfer pilus assembly protein TraK